MKRTTTGLASLGEVIPKVGEFLIPVFLAVRDGLATAGTWPPGGPWR